MVLSVSASVGFCRPFHALNVGRHLRCCLFAVQNNVRTVFDVFCCKELRILRFGLTKLLAKADLKTDNFGDTGGRRNDLSVVPSVDFFPLLC